MKTATGKKNIVFVSLFGLTELYAKIAEHLQPHGIDIFWITTNQLWTHFLIKSGYPRDHILELVYSPDDFLDEGEKKSLNAEIARCETFGDLTVNQVLLMDRFLVGRRRPEINDYMLLYYRDIKRFLRDNHIDTVFAEPTNSNEMITWMICRELNIAYLSPRDMRFPARRLVFFDDYRQETVRPRPDGGPRVDGRQVIDQFAGQKPTPFYFNKLNGKRVIFPTGIARSALRRLRARRVLKQPSLTHYYAAERLRLTLRRSVNSFYMRHLCPYDNLNNADGPLVLYGLHVQPENAVDVLGSFYSDQLKLIKDIRRALPFDATLLVKEHPNFLGVKKIGFFRELRRLPNVRLIKHDVSTFDLYRKVSMVVTISGTAAYEAGLLGIPAVTFSPMFFGGLSSVYHCTDLPGFKTTARKLLDGFARDLDADARFMENLISQSYDAYWVDPIFDRTVLDPANIENLADAFYRVICHDSR